MVASGLAVVSCLGIPAGAVEHTACPARQPEGRPAQRGTSGSAWELNSSAFCDSESVFR